MAMTKWKSNLERAKRLRGESGLIAYEVATILNQVYEDTEWRAEAKIASDDAANRFLSGFSNFGEFYRLRALLKRYPDQKQWTTRTLGDMERMERIDAGNEAREEAKQRKRQREIERTQSEQSAPRAASPIIPRVASPIKFREIESRVIETEKRAISAEEELIHVKEELRLAKLEIARKDREIASLKARLAKQPALANA